MLDVNIKQTANERLIWAVFANASADECRRLAAEVQKLLVARNIIKPPRIRKEKPAAAGLGSFDPGAAQ